MIKEIQREVRDRAICQFEASQDEFRAIAHALGVAVPARRGGPEMDRLLPRQREEAPARSLSSAYGLSEFPFHTDAAHHRRPPRYVLLRLGDGCRTSVPTLMLDFRGLRLGRSVVRALAREVWLVRGGRRRTFYANILDAFDGVAGVRFDPGCMRPAPGTVPRGYEVLAAAVAGTEPLAISWRKNGVAVIDNRRMLHARPAVGEVDRDRTLERVMVR